MASKFDFMKSRKGIIINTTSKKMEQTVIVALLQTVDYISNKFNVVLDHVSNMYLKDIVIELREKYRDVDFSYRFDSSSMRPDGGILSIVSKDNKKSGNK
jgi:hypothetical protein